MSAVIINVDTSLTNIPTINIGKQGENKATQVVFDVSEMIDTYGSGTAVVVVQRRGDLHPYELDNTSQSGDKVTWTVSNTDTAVYGTGRVQLFWTINDEIAKTVTYAFFVEEALSDPTDAPYVPDGGWISEKIGDLDSLTTTDKDNLVEAINEVDGNTDANATNITTNATAIGTLANLTTTEKSNLVGAINEVNADVSDLKEDYTNSEIKHYGGDITSFTWVDGFIYNDSVSSNSGWQRTAPIQLKEGETLSFTGGKGDTVLPINAISKYDDGTYSTLKSYSGTGSESISYTATAEIYVVVSVKKDVYSNNLTVTKIGDISSIPEYVYDSINPTVINMASGVAVNYPIVANTTYLIENRGANNITLSTRFLPSSTSVDVISLPVNSIRELKTSGNANYIVSNGSSTIAIGKSDTLELFIAKTKKAIVNKGDSIPLVNFTFSKDMFDFTSDLSGIDFMDNNGSWYSIPETITTKFDSLVSSYSSYVSKVDAGSDVNLPYPSYANLNGTASGNYQATPTYKTYLYKFETNDNYVNGTSLNKKKKVLLIGATHGSETAGAFNLYLFAKNLCECANEDYFKLRSAFDFYIVPCLNGYGMYHLLRWNANGVNINRNYPIANFEMSGQPYEDDYTGASAGSEFETQLIIKLHEKYSFDVAIDHHNYGVSNMQFYTESWFERFRPLSNSALVDCAFSFIKNKASYFGNNYQLFVQTENATLPIVTLSDSMPCMAKWFFEKGIDYAATIEISNTINYVNGTLSPSESNPKYTADVFAVGEFTFRNQILHYGGLVLGGSGD